MDGNLALLVGEILGALMARGFTIEPIMDDGNYTNTLRVERPSGDYILTIEAEHG